MLSAKIKIALFEIKNSMRRFGVVLSGSFFSQILTILILPLLTRNYSTEDFGYFTAFIAIYSVCTSFVTGKYERAIFLSNSKEDIINISQLSLKITILFTLLIVISIIPVYNLFELNKNGYKIEFIKWLFALAVLLPVYCINLIVTTYLNFVENYTLITKTKLLKTISSLMFIIVFIYLSNNISGLILSEIISLILSTTYIIWKCDFNFQFMKINYTSNTSVFKKYLKFPLYNIPSDFLNIASQQLPIFFLTSIFGIHTAGNFSLMKRILDAPVNLISTSVLDILRPKIAKSYLVSRDCKNLLQKITIYLTILSSVPFFIIFLFGSNIFSFIFGNDWSDSGNFASLLSIYYFFKFISSPISYIFIIAEKQHVDFYLHVFMFLSTFFIFYLSNYFSFNITDTILLYSLNLSFIYITYLYLSFYFSKNR